MRLITENAKLMRRRYGEYKTFYKKKVRVKSGVRREWARSGCSELAGNLNFKEELMDKYLRKEYHGEQIDLSKINEKKTCLKKNYWEYCGKNTLGFMGYKVETNELFASWIGSENKSYCHVNGEWVYPNELDSYAVTIILDDSNKIQDIEFYLEFPVGCGARDYKTVKKVPEHLYHDFWEELSEILVGWEVGLDSE